MAFPTLNGTVAHTNGSTAADPVTVTMPGSIAVGELLFVLFRASDATIVDTTAGWNVLANSTADASDDVTAILWKIAEGGDTLSVNLSASAKHAAIAWRIGGTATTGDIIEISTVATGTSTTPDPTTCTPTGGAKDYLWLWAGGWEGEQTLSTNPTNYFANGYATSGTGGAVAANCQVRVLSRALNAASEDAGAQTISASSDWTAWLVAIHPAPSGTTYTQSLSGGLSFSGSIAKRGNKSLTGGLSFSGSIAKRANKSLAGVLSFAGSIAKQTSRSLAGGLSFSGSLTSSRLFFKELAGSLSFSGSMSKRTDKALSGGLSFAGSIAKRTNKALSGGLSFSGSIAKRTDKALSGALSFSGSIAKETRKALSGALSFAGNLTTQLITLGTTYYKELAGSLSFSGSLAKETRRSLSGVLGFSGSLAKQTARSLSAGLSFAGSLGTYVPQLFTKAFAATLTFTGSLDGIRQRVVDALSVVRGRVRYPWYGRGLGGRRK